MKNLYLLILLLSLSYVFSDSCYTDPIVDDSDLDDCIDLSTPSDYDSCCLLIWSYDGKSGRSCFSITKDEVTNRDAALEKLKKKYSGSTGKIVCKGEKEDNTSSFLKISLIYLLVLLL